MIEIYRDRDGAKVGMLQSILEGEGIRTLLRNQHAVTNTTGVPIPDMFPNICVMDDADAERAKAILEAFLDPGESAALPEWTCPQCGESNEGIFSECWSCQTPRPDLPTADA